MTRPGLPHRRRHRPGLWAGVFLGLLIALGSLRCGSDKKDNDKDDPDQPDSPDGTLPTPGDWDGSSDWSGSAWKFVDE